MNVYYLKNAYFGYVSSIENTSVGCMELEMP